MALTNAERQKRHRERSKPRKAAQKLVVTQEQKQAAEKLVQAETAARVTGTDTALLWAAFEAGVAARLFAEAAQGITASEGLLLDWLESDPEGIWMFHQFLADRGLWGRFQSWSVSRSGALAVR